MSEDELEAVDPDDAHEGLLSAVQELVEKGVDAICLTCVGRRNVELACRKAAMALDDEITVVNGVVMGIHFLTGMVRAKLQTARTVSGGDMTPTT